MSLPLLFKCFEEQPERVLVYRYDNAVRGDLIGVFHVDDLHQSAPNDVDTLHRELLSNKFEAIVSVELK